MTRWDVVVVGSGNAALSAAQAAREEAARVLVVEKAPASWAGGNSYFSAGAMRTTFASLDDLRPLLDDLPDDLAARTEVVPYSPADFRADMVRVTEGRCDPRLTDVLATEAAPTLAWLHAKGIRFRLMFERQSYQAGGMHRFWGGLAVGVVGGGQGLVEQHLAAAAAGEIEVRYDSPVTELMRDEQGGVAGVVVAGPSGREEIAAAAVVLACGGFEADPRRRAMYLGPGWDVAKVRGTPFNTGEGLDLAIAAGAQARGHWSGCHAIAWDAGAPATGDRALTNRYSRQGYPVGIVVNREGRRFVDEGADFRNYTYAKYGAEIMRQPGALAFQLFDARTVPLLNRLDYAMPGVSRHESATVGELAGAIGVDPDRLRQTVAEFNAAAQSGVFDPSLKDGKRTLGLDPPKSNWALPLESPPFVSFPVTCGITFTFGGVAIDEEGRVLDSGDRSLPGLFAAGEMVGGLFFHNYPGGTGLTAGSVFGRRAGRSAARYARRYWT